MTAGPIATACVRAPHSTCQPNPGLLGESQSDLVLHSCHTQRASACADFRAAQAAPLAPSRAARALLHVISRHAHLLLRCGRATRRGARPANAAAPARRSLLSWTSSCRSCRAPTSPPARCAVLSRKPPAHMSVEIKPCWCGCAPKFPLASEPAARSERVVEDGGAPPPHLPPFPPRRFRSHASSTAGPSARSTRPSTTEVLAAATRVERSRAGQSWAERQEGNRDQGQVRRTGAARRAPLDLERRPASSEGPRCKWRAAPEPEQPHAAPPTPRGRERCGSKSCRRDSVVWESCGRESSGQQDCGGRGECARLRALARARARPPETTRRGTDGALARARARRRGRGGEADGQRRRQGE